MIDRVVHQLRQTRLFSALQRDDLEAVAELAHQERYPRGSLVVSQGQPGGAGYLLLGGELRALRVGSDGIRREIDRLEPGQFFGESSLLVGEPHDATVEATEDAQLLVIERSDFDPLLADRPWLLKDLRVSREVEERRRAPRFDWQEPEEVVVFVLRKHPAVFVRRLILPGLLLLLILAAHFYVGSTALVALILGGVLLAVPLLLVAYYLVDQLNDKYVLTNKRVIHDEQIFLIRRSRVGARLSSIQSIQHVQEGVLARTFDFGDLHIETAGEPGGLVAFPQIPHPVEVQSQIFRERDRLAARVRAEERAATHDALHQRLGPGEAEMPEAEPIGRPENGPDGRGPAWPSELLAPLRVARYFFPALRYEEGDTITWRKHWVALLGPIARPTAAIAIVTLLVAWFLSRDGHTASLLLSYGIVLIFLVPWWLWVFEDWQNEIYQVTSSRIIDIEQRPFGLREERREASLSMIQNVSLTVPGLIGRVLGYGTVTIETAGAGAFTFDYVKNPESVQTEIFRRVERFEENERHKRARRRRDELLDWFTVYDQMRHPDEERGDGPMRTPSSQRESRSDVSSSN